MSSALVKVSNTDKIGQYLQQKIRANGVALPIVSVGGVEYLEVTPGLYSDTVANLQALAAGNGLVPGGFYEVTNPSTLQADVAGSYITMAVTDALLAPIGVGIFQNSAMSLPVVAIMKYSLGNNFISEIITSETDIKVTEAVYGSIVLFPFDHVGILRSTFIDPSLLNFSVAGITDSYFGSANVFDVQNSSFIVTTTSDANAIINMGASAGSTIINCSFGNQATVTMPNNQTMTNCNVGNNETVDMTGWTSGSSATGKVIQNGHSTFVATTAEDPNMDINASNELIMTNSAFCGVALISNSTGFQLDSIIGMLASHNLQVVVASFSVDVRDTGVGGGNIYFDVANTVNVLAPSDWITFQKNPNNTALINRVSSYIRV